MTWLVNKGKNVKFILQLAMRAQSGSTDIALLFLQHRRQIGVGEQRHASAAFPKRKRTDLYCTVGMNRKAYCKALISAFLSSVTQ